MPQSATGRYHALVDAVSTSDGDGYVEGIPYTCGYHPDLDPVRMQAALRRAGFEPPQVETACELGYGQGISLAIHAVAGGARWWGTDLMPEHAVHARSLVAGTGARLEVADQPFAVFCARDDLPSFDFIGLYGVWSWISAANRACIVDLAARKLRPGGVLYLSYNALPGWAPMLPLREALVERAAVQPAAAPLAARIEAAMAHVGARVARDACWVDAHPGIEAEWRAIRHKGVAYLAHEFFNRDWAPMDPCDVAAALAAADLQFAAHAAEKPPTPSGRFRREYFVRRAASDEAACQRPPSPGAPGRPDAVGVRTLNDRLLALALRSPGPAWLADPATGGAVEIGYAAMLMVEAWRRGITDPAGLAREAEAALLRLGQRLVRDGEVIADMARMRAMLETDARGLLAETLPGLLEKGAIAAGPPCGSKPTVVA